MDGTRFKLDLKLQNLSMISIAEKLWDSQDIKNQIQDYFSGRDLEYPDENWCEISKLVVQCANSINLPPSLSVLLKKTILLIGQKIYDWTLYVTQILDLDFFATEKIYFSFGLVDEIKIFDLYWTDLKDFDHFIYDRKYFFTLSRLFSLACVFGCELFVKERTIKMLDKLSKSYSHIKTGDVTYNMMSVSICMAAGKSIFNKVVPPKLMFEVCLEAGFSKASRFYWEKLDEVEKVSNLTNFAKKCWRKDYDPSFLTEKQCENLLFLINQMRDEERYLFFTGYADQIIKLFLPVWPYQELIVDLLKYDWNIESSRLLKMADFLISLNERMNRLEFRLDNELVFQIMQKAWGNIPVDEKLRFFTTNQYGISKLFLTLNPEILNLVFNDPNITEVGGKKLDSFIKKGFVELVKKGKFDFLNTIIETIFDFIPEPKDFLEERFADAYELCQLMANDESFGFLNQFLDWLAESEAERARLKNEINTNYICKFLTEWPHGLLKFELADKFLKWRLETDAEVKSFKEEMKSYNFVIVESSAYVRIKSGDLSWLRRGDSLATHRYDYLHDIADGFTFLKFEDATDLNRGVVLGMKSFCSGREFNFFGPDGSRAKRWLVYYVGTNVGDFIVFTVRQIWSNNGDRYIHVREFVELSNAYIKFYYETEEEVLKFKRTKLPVLVSENPVEFLLDALYAYGDVPETFLDDFCEFCMMSSKEIEEIKIRQRSHIEKFLDTYLIDERNYELADYYVNWLFGEVKKKEVCKQFLNSSNKASLLCVSYLKHMGQANPFNYDSYLEICRWLTLVDDMQKLKNDVFALYENTPEWFPAILDRSAQSDVNSTW